MDAPATFYAYGKLLLSAEYLVLDGAKALAVPTKPGQSMQVYKSEGQGHLVWEGLLPDGQTWLEVVFGLPNLNILQSTDTEAASRLQQLLAFIRDKNPALFGQTDLYTIQTQLDFDPSWGLGSSATLVSLLAQWSGVDAYELLQHSFGGSGYDIACATAEGPLLYTVADKAEQVALEWPFEAQMLFVHLGNKQNSREGIAHYRAQQGQLQEPVQQVNQLTEAMIAAQSADDMIRLLLAHEQLLGKVLNLPLVQQQYFPDFPGVVKSLGAWGGDFVLALANQPLDTTRQYFTQKGYTTAFSWEQLIFAKS